MHLIECRVPEHGLVRAPLPPAAGPAGFPAAGATAAGGCRLSATIVAEYEADYDGPAPAPAAGGGGAPADADFVAAVVDAAVVDAAAAGVEGGYDDGGAGGGSTGDDVETGEDFGTGGAGTGGVGTGYSDGGGDGNASGLAWAQAGGAVTRRRLGSGRRREGHRRRLGIGGGFGESLVRKCVT